MRKFHLLAILLLTPPAFAATGDILEVEIASDGWHALILVEGMSTGGTYAPRLGLGPNNDPASGQPLLVLHVTSMGFTDSGLPTTIDRLVYGTTEQRLAYPEHHLNDEAKEGDNVVLKVALSDYVYSKDQSGEGNSGTDVAFQIGAGFYAEGGIVSNSGAGNAVNSSLAPYQSVIMNWTWPASERVTDVIRLRVQAYHRHPRQARPVRAIRFTATDGQTTVEQVVTEMTLDPDLTEDTVPHAEYLAELDPSTFEQGALVTCNAIAYPWVGDNPMRSATGPDHPTPSFGPVTYLIDTAGDYGVTYAKVDPIEGDNQTAHAYNESEYDWATADSFETIADAIAAIAAYNKVHYGRETTGAGVVHLTPGGYDWPGSSGSLETRSDTWVTITSGPGITRPEVSISGQNGRLNGLDFVIVENCTITSEAANTFSDIDRLWFDRCEFDTPNRNLVSHRNRGVWYVTRSVLTELGQGLKPKTRENYPCALLRGSILKGFKSGILAYTITGNHRRTTFDASTLLVDTVSGQTCPKPIPIISNNLFMGFRSMGELLKLGDSTANSEGLALVQNIFERINGPASLGNIGASEKTAENSPLDNFIIWHNLFLGGRMQFGYNSADPPNLKLRRFWSCKGNYWDARGLKSDTFTPPSEIRVGNWPLMWQVGCSGNIDAGISDIAAQGFNAEYSGLSSLEPVDRGPDYPDFVEPKRWNGSEEGEGQGNYHVSDGSPLLTLNPEWILPFDLDGSPRRSHNKSIGPYNTPISGPPTHPGELRVVRP